MNRALWRAFVAIATVLTFHLGAQTMHAEEKLVFISAFASGKDAAIQAYHPDLDSGKLKPAARTTDVENPFYLAISPDQKFLYSIHAKNFGGKESEEIAAYEIVGKDGKLKLLNRQSAHGSAACYLD